MGTTNAAASDLWAQIFSRAVQLPDAALHDPAIESVNDRESRMANAFHEAGWNSEEIKERLEADRELAAAPNVNSPGVAPGLEAILGRLSSRIQDELHIMGFESQDNVELAIDPKYGVSASLINVIMTNESILTVNSFLFRWCGLIARAYTRTLLRDIGYWSYSKVSKINDISFFLEHPDIAIYWMQILFSFTKTGTHAMVPYQPCTPKEIIIMEQIAYSMEYYTIAHEYGHHILNHRSVDANPIEQEFEADMFSFRICERIAMEPFKTLYNPYLGTGAGATIMLKSLSIKKDVELSNSGKIIPDTHPPIDDRISRILSRNVLQQKKWISDQSFNKTAIRVMNAVGYIFKKFLENIKDREDLKST